MLKRIYLFAALLPVSFLLFAMAWLIIAPEHLYHCWDDAPPFLISWAPPFIHPWANSINGNLSDYFIAPEWPYTWFGPHSWPAHFSCRHFSFGESCVTEGRM